MKTNLIILVLVLGAACGRLQVVEPPPQKLTCIHESGKPFMDQVVYDVEWIRDDRIEFSASKDGPTTTLYVPMQICAVSAHVPTTPATTPAPSAPVVDAGPAKNVDAGPAAR